jgi:hypothetical protein
VAFKLNRRQASERADLVERFAKASGELESAVEEFNDKIGELKAPVEAALATYNEIAVEAAQFAADIASEAETAIDEKSEKWQDGDRGQAAMGWKDEWEALSFDEVEIDFPDELDFNNPDYGAVLEQTPDEASY